MIQFLLMAQLQPPKFSIIINPSLKLLLMDNQTDKSYVRTSYLHAFQVSNFQMVWEESWRWIKKIRMMDKTRLGNHAQNKEQNHTPKKYDKNNKWRIKLTKNEEWTQAFQVSTMLDPSKPIMMVDQWWVVRVKDMILWCERRFERTPQLRLMVVGDGGWWVMVYLWWVVRVEARVVRVEARVGGWWWCADEEWRREQQTTERDRMSGSMRLRVVVNLSVKWHNFA